MVVIFASYFKNMKTAIIGSGTMGNGIAHTFAQYGYSVTLIDISDEFLKKDSPRLRRT